MSRRRPLGRRLMAPAVVLWTLAAGWMAPRDWRGPRLWSIWRRRRRRRCLISSVRTMAAMPPRAAPPAGRDPLSTPFSPLD